MPKVITTFDSSIFTCSSPHSASRGFSSSSEGCRPTPWTCGHLWRTFGGRRVKPGSARPLTPELKVTRDLDSPLKARAGPSATLVFCPETRGSRRKQTAARDTLVIEGCCYRLWGNLGFASHFRRWQSLIWRKQYYVSKKLNSRLTGKTEATIDDTIFQFAKKLTDFPTV